MDRGTNNEGCAYSWCWRYPARTRVALVATGLVALGSVAMAQQRPADNPEQCYAPEQMLQCNRNLANCSAGLSTVIQQRATLSRDLDSLKRQTCAADGEPKWKTIIEAVVKNRLQGLERARTPSGPDCEEFKYVVRAPGKLEFEGRLRNRDAAQTAKADLQRQLPGLEIDDSKLKLQTGECQKSLPGIDGYGFTNFDPLREDGLTDAMRRRLPPAEDCGKLGGAIERLPSPEIKERAERGLWVMKNGLLALCRRSRESNSGGWEATVTTHDPGLVPQRDTE